MNKTELLQTICNKLNDAQLTEIDSSDILSVKQVAFSTETGTVKELNWLPEENLEKIANFDVSGYATFREVYQAWGRNGFFKFKPYLAPEGRFGGVTMVLRHNRFLHMFRGYHFQISDTVKGIGSVATSIYRTDNILTGIHHHRHAYEQSKLVYMLIFANMVDVGFQNDNFAETFYSNREFVDDFFMASMSHWHWEFPYDSKVLDEYISYIDGSLLSIYESTPESPIYGINLKSGCVCRFKITDAVVAVEYNPTTEGKTTSRTVMLKIPDVIDGVSERELREADADDIREYFVSTVVKGQETIQRMLLLMMLKFVGINTNYTSTYAIRKVGAIRPARDGENVASFNTCNDFVESK